jgi:hypothetical protein
MVQFSIRKIHALKHTKNTTCEALFQPILTCDSGISLAVSSAVNASMERRWSPKEETSDRERRETSR